MNNVEFARHYLAKLGWSIIPILPNGKRAMVPWKQYQEELPRLFAIEQWFSNDRTVNVGLATGRLSGVVVVDEDSYKENFQGLTISSPLYATTPRGGKHLYFKYTDGVSNSVNADRSVDVRGDGGYVLLPPSTIDGKAYTWNTTPTPELIQRLPTLPTQIIAQLHAERTNNPFKMSESIGVAEGGRDVALTRGVASILNSLKEEEWDTVGWSMVEAMNNTYSPPLPDHVVQEKFERGKRFIHENPKTRNRGDGWERVGAPRPAGGFVPRSIADVAKERQAEKALEVGAPSTGYRELDRIIKGFLPGRLYTLTGSENVGKTSIACNFAVRVAKQGKKVLYFALEPENMVVDYLASCRLNKRFDQLTQDDIEIDDGNIAIFGKEQISRIDDLVAAVNELPRYDLIVVDHIGYFITGENNLIQEQSNAIKKLAGLSKSKQCAIMLIAHLRKPPAGSNRNYTPSSNDISGSGAFKQDSTEVMIVKRIVDENQDGLVYTQEGTLHVTKTKSGPNGSMSLHFSDNKAIIMSTEEVFGNVGVVTPVNTVPTLPEKATELDAKW